MHAEHVTVVNDDGMLVHHAHIEALDLSYNAGDIEPGVEVLTTFPKWDDFAVLCGIDLRMKLAVHVR